MAVASKTKAPRQRKATRNGRVAASQETPEGERMFCMSADDWDAMDDIVGSGGSGDVDRCNAGNLSMLIHNKGNAADRAEALVAIMPIARRIWERENAT